MLKACIKAGPTPVDGELTKALVDSVTESAEQIGTRRQLRHNLARQSLQAKKTVIPHLTEQLLWPFLLRSLTVSPLDPSADHPPLDPLYTPPTQISQLRAIHPVLLPLIPPMCSTWARYPPRLP